mmetsp:Transcript_6204/g.18709  ORF Transcript_6204/g.18709 Transcript_6204/m.18709 type:complete len:205 (+) Transcript_6204:281-895(+)
MYVRMDSSFCSSVSSHMFTVISNLMSPVVELIAAFELSMQHVVSLSVLRFFTYSVYTRQWTIMSPTESRNMMSTDDANNMARLRDIFGRLFLFPFRPPQTRVRCEVVPAFRLATAVLQALAHLQLSVIAPTKSAPNWLYDVSRGFFSSLALCLLQPPSQQLNPSNSSRDNSRRRCLRRCARSSSLLPQARPGCLCPLPLIDPNS